MAVEEEIEHHVMALDKEFKSFLLQKYIGTMVLVRFPPKGDIVDDSCYLFLEACNSDCITLVQQPARNHDGKKAGGKASLITVAQKRSHIPLHYVLVINNPTGVVLSFDRWWWENDF